MTPPRPPHVVFMCGAAGSGKTTTARALEAEGFTRLSIDAEACARGWLGVITREQAAVIDAELRERLDCLLAEGRDVVLDYSFSTAAMRDAFRGRLPVHDPVTVFVRTPRATALARLSRRAEAGGDGVVIDPAAAAAYFDDFEVPTPAEGPLVVIDGTAPVDGAALGEALAAATG